LPKPPHFIATPHYHSFAGAQAFYFSIKKDLAAGVYTFDEVEGFNGEAFLWSALEGKHLLDNRPGKLIV